MAGRWRGHWRRDILRGLEACQALATASSGASAASSLRPAALPACALGSYIARVSGVPHLVRGAAAAPAAAAMRSYSAAALPPHTELQMPALSPTMSQGNIAAWKKKEGEEIAAGDVLCEVETDKATMDWEAQDEGYLAKIIVAEGAKDIPVGTPVAVVVEDSESVSAFSDYEPGAAPAPEAAAAPEPAAAEDDGGKEAPEAESGGSGGSGEDYPPHTVMGLPALSPTMSQGNIAAWKKAVGDEVAAGDSFAEIETDKATMDWESQDDGYVAALLVPEGAKDVPAGSPVLVFVEDQESVAAFKDFSLEDAKASAGPKKDAKPKQEAPTAAAAPPSPSPPTQGQQPAATSAPKPAGGRVIASPYARKLAGEAGVDLARATGTGPDGRIVAADVEQLIKSGGGAPAPAAATGAPAPGAVGPTTPSAEDGGEWTDEKHSQIRRITAQRLLESKQTIPHYYLTVDCRVDKLAALRAELNERLVKSGAKLSLNDFVIKAAALALRKVPDANASWFPDFIRRYNHVDISVAVQTPAGLMVPVLHDADALGLADISARVKALAMKAKEGKLKPDEMSGGTFTVSNLGMFGVTQFAAIINPPQACILAIGGTEKRVMAGPGGLFTEASVMAVTLSCDHRVVDGALGATWLQAFRGYLEDPATMLL